LVELNVEEQPWLKAWLLLGYLFSVTFFLPWVGVVVVAVTLPKAQAIGAHKFDATQPFGALPTVFIRHKTSVTGKP